MAEFSRQRPLVTAGLLHGTSSPQLQKGQRVKFVRARTAYQAKLCGAYGRVLRNRGLGRVEVQLDDGRVINPELWTLDYGKRLEHDNG